jgi:dihydroneopterin aldolase
MAILAMNQMAQLFMDMQPRLVGAEQLAAFDRAWATSNIPIWLPTRLAEKDRRIPANWSITSDGLAARLAERVGAATVILVKSGPVSRSAPLEELVERDIVDAEFARIVVRSGLDWLIIGPDKDRELARILGTSQARKK